MPSWCKGLLQEPFFATVPCQIFPPNLDQLCPLHCHSLWLAWPGVQWLIILVYVDYQENLNCRQLCRNLTHITKLCCSLEVSALIALLPDNSSSRTIPKAYTSILLLIFPYMKYSGARYPNVPTTSASIWKDDSVGPHIASPKSDNC